MFHLFQFVVAFLMCVVPPAMARGIDHDAARGAGFYNLTETQKAEILQQIAEKSAKQQTTELVPSLVAAATTATSAPEAVDQWLNIGERVGKMIGGAAKEVGMVVNDFVKTPVGMVAMGLIVWNYMGTMIVHVVGGMFVIILGTIVVWYFARRSRGEVITYDPERRDIFNRSVKVSHTKNEMDSGFVAGYLISMAVVIVAGLITMFTF